jgi:hypothetical protein
VPDRIARRTLDDHDMLAALAERIEIFHNFKA